MDATREEIFSLLHSQMEDVGFLFEREQIPHRQHKREKELVFIHPLLLEKFGEEGHEVRAKKYYIKPLSDDPDCAIGLVTGVTSPLLNLPLFPETNAIDTYRDIPAWTNKDKNNALYDLLLSIENYLENDSLPEEVDVNVDLFEGAKKQIIVNRYERNPVARALCVKHHGFICSICEFDFLKVYGDVGREFIHVHHIVPLHSIDKNYRIDYQVDLIPVCPNCHAMLHRKIDGKELSIDELKRRIMRNRIIEQG